MMETRACSPQSVVELPSFKASAEPVYDVVCCGNRGTYTALGIACENFIKPHCGDKFPAEKGKRERVPWRRTSLRGGCRNDLPSKRERRNQKAAIKLILATRDQLSLWLPSRLRGKSEAVARANLGRWGTSEPEDGRKGWNEVAENRLREKKNVFC